MTTINFNSCYQTFQSWNGVCPLPLTEALLLLESKPNASLQSIVKKKIEFVDVGQVAASFGEALEARPTEAMIKTCVKIMSANVVQKLMKAKGIDDFILFQKDVRSFLPIITTPAKNLDIRATLNHNIEWLTKLFKTIFLTFSYAYNIDVENPPSDNYRAQSQLLFFRSMVSDGLILTALIGTAFALNLYAGIALIAAIAIGLTLLILIYKIFLNRCPEYLPDCTNLNLKVKAGKTMPALGRDNEMKFIIDALSSSTRNDGANVMLLGDPGVGKTQLATELARRIVRGEVPEKLKRKTVFSVNAAQLASEQVGYNNKTNRVENPLTLIFKAIEGYESEAIFFIDEIHVASKSPDKEGVSITELLKTELEERNITCIVATTKEEYDQDLKNNEAFIQRFTPIMVEAPGNEDMELILQAYVNSAAPDLIIPNALLQKIIQVTHELFPAQANPRKANSFVKTLINKVQNWKPEKIAQGLIDLRLKKERLLAEAREKICDSDWIVSEEGIDLRKSLQDVAKQISEIESLEARQLQQIQNIRSLYSLHKDNIAALRRKLPKSEFLIRSLIFDKAIQRNREKLTLEFERQWNEPFISTITEGMVEALAASKRESLNSSAAL